MGNRSFPVVQAIVPGVASAIALVLDEPLSFWGGLDAESGRVIDQRHPQVDVSISGRVLFMTVGRGSSSASSVLAEAIRLGTAPAALVMVESDEIIALGSMVAEEIYGITMPIVLISAADHALIRNGDTVDLDEMTVSVTREE